MQTNKKLGSFIYPRVNELEKRIAEQADMLEKQQQRAQQIAQRQQQPKGMQDQYQTFLQRCNLFENKMGQKLLQQQCEGVEARKSKSLDIGVPRDSVRNLINHFNKVTKHSGSKYYGTPINRMPKACDRAVSVDASSTGKSQKKVAGGPSTVQNCESSQNESEYALLDVCIGASDMVYGSGDCINMYELDGKISGFTVCNGSGDYVCQSVRKAICNVVRKAAFNYAGYATAYATDYNFDGTTGDGSDEVSRNTTGDEEAYIGFNSDPDAKFSTDSNGDSIPEESEASEHYWYSLDHNVTTVGNIPHGFIPNGGRVNVPAEAAIKPAVRAAGLSVTDASIGVTKGAAARVGVFAGAAFLSNENGNAGNKATCQCEKTPRSSINPHSKEGHTAYSTIMQKTVSSKESRAVRCNRLNCNLVEGPKEENGIAYESKTKISKTDKGVRITIDIEGNLCSIEDMLKTVIVTEIPESRILTEFHNRAHGNARGSARSDACSENSFGSGAMTGRHI